MRYNLLGRTGIRVSRICLGTMTYGQQNTAEEAFAQMDMAFDRGVNFLDTAEMYSFPARPETQGRSEEIIGAWMAARGNRDKVVVATKITGPGERFAHIRGGDGRFGPKQIAAAVDLSLKRLKTDYIDLYQLHWPERSTNFFGALGYEHVDDEEWTPFEDMLDGMDRVVKAGKVRAVGCSNETPWGLMRMLDVAERAGLPRMASIQNPYSLLNRVFEIGLAEVAIREDCGLLPYSPLAFGVLTGKYQGGARPPGARLTLFPSFQRYVNPRSIEATERYLAIAREHGLDPAQMALAYVNTRRFVTSNIIGATTLEQLDTDLGSDDIELSDAVLESIEAVHAEIPNPSP